MNKLTAKSVEKLKKQGYYSDGNNLYLQVSKSLNKSWLFIYKKMAKKPKLVWGVLNLLLSLKLEVKPLNTNK